MSSSHPRMVLCSSNPASALSLFRTSMSLHGIGSLGCFGQAHVWMASRGAFTLNGVICAFDDNCCLDEVINLYTSSAWQVDGYIDDKFGPFCKWDKSVQKFHGWDKMLARRVRCVRVPIIVEKYFIGQVADAL